MTLVKLNAADYGLKETKAKEISDMFKPMLDTMTGLEKEYNKIIKLPLELDTCKQAHDLRMKYVKVRTGTKDIHKELKAFYLNGGRFVDGWKNTQVMASQGIEDKLSAIENHYVNIEKDRITKLQESRKTELEKYEVLVIPENLGEMQEEIWKNFVLGTKTNYDNQKEAERKAELSITRKNETTLYIDLIPGYTSINFGDLSNEAYNGLLKKAKESKEAADHIVYLSIERKNSTRLLIKYIPDYDKIKFGELSHKKYNDLFSKAVKDEQTYLAEQEKIRKENEKLRKNNEAIEKELQDKKNAEEKAVKDAALIKEAELKKGDSDKIQDLIADLTGLKMKYTFKSKGNKAKYLKVGELLEKVISFIKE